jgi:uncharacterized membrane protein YdjX (TVP38/TMEM64 family)
MQDKQQLEALVDGLGPAGPVVLVAFNALQIVVAPVPGYVIQIVSGYLYGPLWGGIWGSLGLLAGSMLAMWLARAFGRPLAERLVGKSRLDRWETVTHSNSLVIWFILILSPTGDLPYFLAGLSRVRFSTIFLLTLAIRVPTTFVVASAGAGVMLLTWWQLGLTVALLTGFLVVFMRNQARIVNWLDDKVHRKLSDGRRIE